MTKITIKEDVKVITIYGAVMLFSGSKYELIKKDIHNCTIKTQYGLLIIDSSKVRKEVT